MSQMTLLHFQRIFDHSVKNNLWYVTNLFKTVFATK